MDNKKWGIEHTESDLCHVVLFVSRNKDNNREGYKIENFKERRRAFITDEPFDSERLKKKFNDFVEEGVEGETSRFYYSVNARHVPTVRTKLLHFLIDNPNFNLSCINGKIAGLAAEADCAAERKWLFDFDIKDTDVVQEFLDELSEYAGEEVDVEVVKPTPNGFAIVVSRGFDSRKLCSDYRWEGYVCRKKDDMLYIESKTKGLNNLSLIRDGVQYTFTLNKEEE